MLFGAVYAGSEKVTALLLKMGANPSLGCNGHTARDCALVPRNRKCLRVFFAAGFEPTGPELMAYFLSDIASDVPTTANEEVLRNFIKGTKQSELSSLEAALLKIGSDANLSAQPIPDLKELTRWRDRLKATNIRRVTDTLEIESKFSARENNGGAKALAQLMVITQCVQILNENPKVLYDAVKTHFFPFRNHSEILSRSLIKAAETVARLWSDKLDLREDDLGLLQSSSLALTGYPIRAVSKGLAS